MNQLIDKMLVIITFIQTRQVIFDEAVGCIGVWTPYLTLSVFAKFQPSTPADLRNFTQG